MIKRAVYRGSEPGQLMAAADLTADKMPHASHRALYAWVLGQAADKDQCKQDPDTACQLKKLLLTTDAGQEQTRVDAAYALATIGRTEELDALFAAVEGADEAPARAATNALASAGPTAVPRLLKALWAGWQGSYGGAKRLASKQRVATAAAYAIGHCVMHLPVGQLGRVASALVSTCTAALSAIDQRLQKFSRECCSKMGEIAGAIRCLLLSPLSLHS